MDAIVADVGGTNTRMAYVSGGQVLPGTVQRFLNDDFADFESIATTFANGHAAPAKMAVAIAGPSTEETGKLTNRDWTIHRASLSNLLGVARVQILNDLAALGHAIPDLPDRFMEPLTPDLPRRRDEQALVVGLGTGFNVSPLKSPNVFSVEFGQTSLPVSVHKCLADFSCGTSAFPTAEHLFCGAGLSRLHVALGNAYATAPEIAAAGSDDMHRTLSAMAVALGEMVRQLAYTYWPLGGIYFNGSLATTMLAEDWRGQVLDPLRNDTAFSHIVSDIPAYLLTDDSAALYGCARYLSEM